MAADHDEQQARADHWGPAVTRFAAANGIELPPPMTEVERADWNRRQDAADEEAMRLYGSRSAAA